ncbi:MAG: GNAT family N-acetyltransferase [Fibrobacteria bacterium]
MTSPFIIREIPSSESEPYRRFFAVGLREDEDNFRISPSDDAEAPYPTCDRADSFTLGAFAGDALCGVVSFNRDGGDREKLRHKGILFRMYVAAAFRGRGIAGMLIRAVLERADRLADIEQINLTVVAGNPKAKALYERAGFQAFALEARAIKWKGGYHDEYQMAYRMERFALPERE